VTDGRGSAARYDVIVVGYGGAGATAAMAARDALFNTQGGPAGGAAGEVIGTGGTPIPGLFSAGELGSIWARCTRVRATSPSPWSSAGSRAAAPPPRRLGLTSGPDWS
jgi:hypothetical protein